ncbi:unnamed protein product, partial [Iphiclides podalirius]
MNWNCNRVPVMECLVVLARSAMPKLRGHTVLAKELLWRCLTTLDARKECSGNIRSSSSLPEFLRGKLLQASQI